MLEVTGYRQIHAPLLSGAWIGGELLCFAENEARSASVATAPPDNGATGLQPSSARLLIVPGAGYIRFSEIEGVHRRARLEVGLQGSFDAALARTAMTLARDTAFGLLNLNRLYGFVRGSHQSTLSVLEQAGFAREATAPGAVRIAGVRVAREVWGALRSEWRP